MSMCQALAAELQQEAKTTRRILERVPEESFGWKPHAKSMSLGRLAAHVAELPELILPALAQDELDFASGQFKPFEPKTTAELLEKFDRNISAAAEALQRQPANLRRPAHLFKARRAARKGAGRSSEGAGLR